MEPKFKIGDVLYWVRGPTGTAQVVLSYLARVKGYNYENKAACYVFDYILKPSHGMWNMTDIDKSAIKLEYTDELEATIALFSPSFDTRK